MRAGIFGNDSIYFGEIPLSSLSRLIKNDVEDPI